MVCLWGSAMLQNFYLLETLLWSRWAQAYSQLLSSMLPCPEKESAMRKFIRHPSDIPIDFQIDENEAPRPLLTKDISVGGLCFTTDKPVSVGKKIHIHIPDVLQGPLNEKDLMDGNAFDADGIVAWCRRESSSYAVGVRFDDQSIHFGLRMVEQICHIEHYRYDVLQGEGRELSSEEAAKEWVERYAAKFPTWN